MDFLQRIPIGATAAESVRVTRELTVAHFHPEMPEVYGTPMMIHLMETAAAEAISRYLPEGWVSVGTHLDIRHVAATPVGHVVTATATVVSVDARTVTLEVEAHDGDERIGTGTHTRAPVEVDRFERRLRTKGTVR